jgi:hypothetical protein
MNMEPEHQPDPGGDVFVPPDIRAASMQLAQSNPAAAASLVRAMLAIPAAGKPIDIVVPDDPPGTKYFAVEPDDEYAPVPIYRSSQKGEHGTYLVVALYPPASYRVRARLPDSGPLSATAAATVVGRGSAR